MDYNASPDPEPEASSELKAEIHASKKRWVSYWKKGKRKQNAQSQLE